MADEFMREPRGIWPWIWGLIILAAVIAEGIALFDPQGGDTLTEQIQWIGGLAPWLFVIGFLGGIIWLVNHFIGPGSRIWKWGKEREEDANG